MSTSVDNQIVQMSFDNRSFEKNASNTISTLDKLKASLRFDGVAKGIDGVSKSLASFPVRSLSNAADAVASKFSIMGTAVDQLVRNAETRIETFTRNAVSQLNIFKNAMSSGFSEYETQVNATQTIWANTKDAGTTMEDITRVLDELNEYADMTIYNFTEMTRNIGTFTAAGVDLNKSAKAIQGIANLGAISGSSSQKVSNAMYQLSQALAAGRVSLMDWNSVVNADMGGKIFQKVLIQTAKEMGTISNELATGLENGSLLFRNTLTENGWLTSEVLTASLEKFTDTSTELGRTATEAATKVKTFTQLIDTLKESVQSGWTQSWEYIIGDFESARTLFTDISNAVTALIQPSMDARNEMLAYWSGANESNAEAEKVLKEQEAHQKEIEALAKRVLSGEFGTGQARYDMLSSLGYDYREVQNAVNHMLGLGDAFNIEAKEADKSVAANEKAGKTISEMTGREATIHGLKNIATDIQRIFAFIKSGFASVFPMLKGWQLTNLSRQFAELTEKIRPSTKALQAIRSVVMTVLNVFKLAGKILGAIGKGIFDAFIVLDKTPVYDKIIAFERKFTEFVQKFTSGDMMGKITSVVKDTVYNVLNLVSLIKNYISELKNLSPKEATSKIFNDMSTFVKSLFSGIGNVEYADSVLGNLMSRMGGTGEKIASILGRFVSNVEYYMEELGMLEVFKAWDPLEILESIGVAFRNFIKNVTIDDIKSIGIIAVLFELRKLMRGMTSLTGSFKSLIDGITGTFFSQFKNETFLARLPNILLTLSGCVALVSGSLFLLANTPSDRAWESLLIMGAALAMLLACVGILKKMQTVDEDVEESGYLPLIATMLTLVYAINSLALRAAVLGKLNKDNDVWDGILMIGTIGALLTLAMKSLGKLSAEGNAKSMVGTMLGYSASFVILSFAFQKIVDAIKPLSRIDALDLLKAGVALAGVTGVISILLLQLAKRAERTKDLYKSALALSAVAVVLTGISNALKDISGLSLTSMATSAIVLVGVSSIVATIIGVLANKTNAIDLLATAGAFMLFSTTFLILSSAISSLAAVPIDDLKAATEIMLIVLGVSSLLLGIMSVLVDAGDLLLSAGAFVIMAIGIKTLCDALGNLSGAGLSNTTIKKIQKLALAIGILIGVFVAVTAVLEAFHMGWIIPVVLVSIGVLALALAALGKVISMVLDSIANFAESLVIFSNNNFSNFGDNVKAVVDGIRINLKSMARLFGDILKEIAYALVHNASSIGQAVGAVLAAIFMTVSKMLTEFAPVITAIGDVLVRIFLDIFSDLLELAFMGLVELVYWIVKGLFAGITAALEAADEELPGLITALGNFLDSFGDALLENSDKINSGCRKIVRGISQCIFGDSETQSIFSVGLSSALIGALGLSENDSNLRWKVMGFGGILTSWIKNGLEDPASEEELQRAAVAAGDKTVSALVTQISKANDGVDAEGVIAGDRYISSLVDELNWRCVEVYGEAQPIGEEMCDGTVDAIGPKLPEITAAGESIGDELTAGTAQGIDDGYYNNVVPAIDRMSYNMVNRAERNLDIHSPSRVFAGIGQMCGAGLAVGLKNSSSEVEEESGGLVQSVVDGVLGALEGTEMGDKLSNTISKITDFTGKIKEGSLMEGLKDSFSMDNLFDDLGLDTTITPVMDLSNVTSGISDMNSMFGTQSLGLSDLNSSFNGSLNMGDIQNGSYNDTNIVASIAKLDARMDALASAISSMQIRMDTGALVGSIAGPMDTALGQRAIYAGRGIR